MDQKYWILICLWAGYFVSHSLLASLKMKALIYSLGISKTGYRKIYVLVSTLGFFALLIYNSQIDEQPLIRATGLIKYLSLFLAAAGTIIIRAAFKEYSIRGFLGFVKENPEKEFKSRGILSYVRHPTYSGTILVVAGFFLFSPTLSSLILFIMVVAYVLIGIYFEEKKLIIEFGQSYIDYKKQVPALVPRFSRIIRI